MVLLNENGYKVYRTSTRKCACFIVETENRCVLIDTSMQMEKTTIKKDLLYLGIKKIDAIFLTHSHTDHVANAKYLSEIYDCKVYISDKGIENLKRGICTTPKGTNLYGKFLLWAESKAKFYNFKIFPACPDVEILNKEVIDFYLGESAELIETSGHSEDSVSILLGNSIGFVGDAMVNSFGKIYPSFANDEILMKMSWKKLLDTKCKMLCPAHGKPVMREKLLLAYYSDGMKNGSVVGAI